MIDPTKRIETSRLKVFTLSPSLSLKILFDEDGYMFVNVFKSDVSLE
jgi:hypothetical protein